MKAFKVNPRQGLLILGGTSDSQATTMVLAPGEVEDGAFDRRTPATDHWLFVLSGTGQAAVKGMRLRLTAGLLLLIAASEAHQILNTGGQPLVTVRLSAPPMV